jgi:hypothetical protein
MIYQTDEEFPPDIQHYGCYFMSLCFQLDRLFNLGIMDHKILISLYQSEESDSDFSAECYIQNPQGLCNHLVPGKVNFLGIKPSDYQMQDKEFEIQHWYNKNTEFYHFVAGDQGAVIYDPIEGGSKTVREGYLESKRIYALV